MSRDDKSRMGARAVGKAANRRAILKAAREVISEKGCEATSVRDVIRRTDLAAGTFYNYFRSKEELFAALANDVLAQFRPRLKQARESSSSPREFVYNSLKAYFDFYLEGLGEYSDIDVVTPVRMAGASALEAVFEETHGQILGFLDEMGIKGVDTEYMAAALLGLAREFRSRLVRRSSPDSDEAARIATTFFLSGLAGLTKDSTFRSA